MDKKKLMKKRALAISTVVGLIILIMGFAILMFFYFQINWTGDVDREVCHQSVIYRATLPAFAGAKQAVPLKCKTEKICITSGFFGGSCKEYENVKGVTKVKVSDVEGVEQEIAKEILTCWETMGEGKISMFTDWMIQTYGFGTMSSECVICSRVAFDKTSLQKSGIDLSKVNVLNYMITHKVPEKDVSYYVYLTGEGGKMSLQDNRKGSMQIQVPGTDGQDENFGFDIEDTGDNSALGKELSVMFMQVQTPPGHWDVLKNDLYTLLGAGAVGSYVATPKYISKGAMALAKSPWTWVVLIIAGISQQASVYQNQAITAGYCGDISAGQSAKQGCSVVRTVNYGADDLQKYCSVVESIP